MIRVQTICVMEECSVAERCNLVPLWVESDHLQNVTMPICMINCVRAYCGLMPLNCYVVLSVDRSAVVEVRSVGEHAAGRAAAASFVVVVVVFFVAALESVVVVENACVCEVARPPSF